MLKRSTIETPIGDLHAAATPEGLVWLGYHKPYGSLAQRPGPHDQSAVLAETAEQIRAYFARSLTGFDLPLAPHGTPFQRAVWNQLAQIPFGSTSTYAAIAEALENPSAVRAVGAANGRNPISIVLPCHRVIGADGTLTGYAGGLDRKRALLIHEGALSPSLF